MHIGDLENMNDINITEMIERIDPVITWMDKVTIVFAAITMITVIYNLFQNRKQLNKIKIYFRINALNNKYILVDENLTRKDLRRSEIQGILANQLIKGEARYNINYLANDKYFEEIVNVQNGKNNFLIIDLIEDEIGQFADLIVEQLSDEEIEKVKHYILEYIKRSSGKPEKMLNQFTHGKLNP